MFTMTNLLFKKRTRWLAVLALSLLVTLPLQAAPPNGKGGGKGGGYNGGGSTAVPEMHHLWRARLDGPYSSVRPAVGPNGTVYAVDAADNLYAVNPRDGSILWRVAGAGSKGVDVGLDGTVYTGNEAWIKAFSPNGDLKWTFVQEPRAFVLVDVAVGPDGNIYAVASSGMGVFSLDPEGRVRWTTPEIYARNFVGYTELEFGPTIDGNDMQLYFYANAHTRAVRLSDGEPVFTVGGGNTPPRVNPVTGNWHRPDSAYAPDAALVWKFDFPTATGTREPTLGNSGTHYAVNSGDVLYAIDLSGFEVWQAALDEYVGLPDVDPAESMILLEAGGTTTHPAALKAVSTRNGSPLWRMEFPAPDDGSGRDQYIDSGVAFDASGNTAYVMTAVAVSGTTYLNAVATDPSLPSASTILRSTDIALSGRSNRKGSSVNGVVTVMDENLGPVSGATVTATWRLPDGSEKSQTATTGGGGTATFSVSGDGGIYRLTVTGMSKDGYSFDDRHGVLTAGLAVY